MKAFRSVLFWIHLTAGLVGGIVILVMSFTGVVLALKPQIQNWIDRDVRYVSAAGTRLDAHELLARVSSATQGAAIQSLALVPDPEVAALVGVAGEGNLYVNPYDGEVLGRQSQKAIDFFQSMTSWHRYMGASGEAREAGRAFTGGSNFAFLILGLTGMYIWWPKQLSARHLRPILWFRRATTSRARDFNWHNTIGFWCVPAIIVMTASGVVMSYRWANNLVYTLSGSPVPAARGAGPGGAGGLGGPGGPGGPAAAVVPATIDLLLVKATAQVPTWSQLSLRFPSRDNAPVSFTITDGAQWNQMARSQLTLNGRTGEVVQWQPYDEQSLGQKIRGWLRFAHTGELGGLTGQIIAGIGCLGGVFLVYTGFALACRRLVNWALWARVGVRSRTRSENVAVGEMN